MVNAKEITEVATAEKDINGIPFSQETLGQQYESDIQAYMQNNNVSRAEAEKIIPRPTKPNELNFYRGETLTPSGEDGVAASPSGNLRAVAANRQGKSASIPLEEAVVTLGHELYGHAYFFRQGNKTWGGHGPVIKAIEDRTRRNYQGGGEQRKNNPSNLKPKE